VIATVTEVPCPGKSPFHAGVETLRKRRGPDFHDPFAVDLGEVMIGPGGSGPDPGKSHLSFRGPHPASANCPHSARCRRK